MSDILRVENLEVEFTTQTGTVRVVDGISFRVRAGSTVAIVGESGSGKSVTSQAIMGILPRTAKITGGSIMFDDSLREQKHGETGEVYDLTEVDPESKTYQALRGNRISIIFQEPMTSLSPLHTIGDQIGEALCIHQKITKKEVREKTVKMLELTGFPDPDAAYSTYPFELSGGLRQRAMIAMALICGPSLLIADEPSTALDVTIQAQILKLIKDLQAELGMAVLLITHDLGVVANVADEVIVVFRGKVMEAGTIEDIFRHPKHPYLKGLFNTIPHFDMKPGQRLQPLRKIDAELGHLTSESIQFHSSDATIPLLEVRSISKEFMTRKNSGVFGSSVNSVKAVDDVSLHIRRGECLGLVGESGSGKSTVSKIIMRAIEADQGEVLFNDQGNQIDILKLGDRQLEELRCKIQYVFQDPFSSLNPRMTVFDILNEPLEIHNVGDNGLRGEMVAQLMKMVGLDPLHSSRYPHSFSGGQRQRIGIARALALKPELLICDEPVSALDVSIQAQVLNLLKDLQEKLGLTYLFISHNLAVVDYVADRIAVMCAGRLVEIAPREVLFANPVHPYTKALISAVPYPDPDRPLDFDALMEGKASIPEAWPEPFYSRGKNAGLIEVGNEHLVRAHGTP